jgi:DNA primase
MKINWKEFLLKEFPKGKLLKGRNGEELVIHCISPDCPNPHDDHMFVNISSSNPKHDKKFICHRCGFSGNHKAFLVTYYGLPYNEILERLSDLYGLSTDFLKEVKKNIKAIKKDNILLLNSEILLGEEKLEIDLPREYKPLNQEIEFTKRRKIPFNMIRKFKMGFCSDGYYEGRLIIPIITKLNKSFIAYSIYSKKAIRKYIDLSKRFPENKLFRVRKKKILNPKSSVHSMLLYNYNNIEPHPKILFLHEGFMDVIRTLLHGYSAVGLGGTNVSEYQARLLDELGAEEICLMLDSDVDMKKIMKAMEMLREHCDCTISFVTLEEGDPDDIRTRNEFKRIIKSRKLLPTNTSVGNPLL